MSDAYRAEIKSGNQEYDPLNPEVRAKIVRFHYLIELPAKRITEAQTKELEETRVYLMENFQAVVEVCSGMEIGDFLFAFEDLDTKVGNQVSYFGVMADEIKKIKIPKMPKQVSPTTITPVIQELYEAQATTYGMLEQLEPALDKWIKYEKRMQLLVKAVTGFTTEWRTEAVGVVVVPAVVQRKVLALAEVVGSLKLKRDALNKAYDMISRLVTLHIEAPAGEMSRSDTSGFGAQAPAPSIAATNAPKPFSKPT